MTKIVVKPYDADTDTVAGVRELVEAAKASSDGEVALDWRYAHTLLLEIDRLRAERGAYAVGLRPGDLLVVTVPRDTSLAQAHEIREMARATLAGYDFEVPVLVTWSPIEVAKADATSTGPRRGEDGRLAVGSTSWVQP